jgi:hypothetical protein
MPTNPKAELKAEKQALRPAIKLLGSRCLGAVVNARGAKVISV